MSHPLRTSAAKDFMARKIEWGVPMVDILERIEK